MNDYQISVLRAAIETILNGLARGRDTDFWAEYERYFREFMDRAREKDEAQR